MTEEQRAEALLRATSTEALLRTAYALTHRMNKRDGRTAEYRAQRDQIDAEILRRTRRGSGAKATQ